MGGWAKIASRHVTHGANHETQLRPALQSDVAMRNSHPAGQSRRRTERASRRPKQGRQGTLRTVARAAPRGGRLWQANARSSVMAEQVHITGVIRLAPVHLARSTAGPGKSLLKDAREPNCP